jgi:hypothetical protein
VAEVVDRARWKWPLRLAVAWGAYVQLLGVSLVHEYDAYLWLAPDGSNESLAWFSPTHSSLLRVPRDVLLSPWDVSADLMTRVNRERTSAIGDGRPVRYLIVGQEGQSILYNWSVSDVAITVGGQPRRAFELGTRFDPAGLVAGTPGAALAVDPDPRSRWNSGRYRRPGMEVRIDLGRALPIDRLDLVHAPYWDDFPSDAWAKASEDGNSWRELRIEPGTPVLGMNGAFHVLLALSVLLIGSALVISGLDRPSALE